MTQRCLGICGAVEYKGIVRSNEVLLTAAITKRASTPVGIAGHSMEKIGKQEVLVEEEALQRVTSRVNLSRFIHIELTSFMRCQSRA